MKDLKIVTNTECFTIEDNNGNIFATFWENDADSESKAKGFIDAHNTYQRTGMTASELEADRNKWENAYVETCKRAGKLSTSLLDMKAERNELEKQRNELLEALKRIEAWQLPETGEFWDDDKTHPVSYEVTQGTNGVRAYIRQVAREAIQSVEQNEKQK